MKLFDWVAAIVLSLQLPIPLFWLIMHPLVAFWRRHMRAGYVVTTLSAWGGVALAIAVFHRRLFAGESAPLWARGIGLALILADLYVIYRVERELGSARLVGHTELQGGGELAISGIYARVRHPRYAGMMFAVLGACLLAGTLLLWVVAAVWSLLALTAVGLEERELRARFGAAYEAYCKRVPRFLPFRFWPSEE